MKYRIISSTVHGLLDYVAAAGLIVLPFLLKLGDATALALWLSVAGGAGLVIYSLLTDYAFGPFKLISYKLHLALDLAAAAAFYAAPFVFAWNGLVAGYYFVMSIGVVAVVLLSRREESAQVAEAA